MYTLELKGKRQQDLPTRRPGQTKGWLVAIEPAETIENDGVVWKCRCEFEREPGRICGGTRRVLAKDFKSHRIKKCETCINPVFKRQQQVLCDTKREKERERERELGDPMYSEEFQRTWREILARFTFEQRFHFEVIMNGRNHWHYQMQAVDIVLRFTDIEHELMNFGTERKRRAWKRVKEFYRANSEGTKHLVGSRKDEGRPSRRSGVVPVRARRAA